MTFSNINEIINHLEKTPQNKIRRTLYEVLENLDLVGINHLENWEELIVFLLKTPEYQSNQGLEHWFYDLYLCDLKENEILFLLPVILEEIDHFNSIIFGRMAELLCKNLSKNNLEDFIKKLENHNSSSSTELIKNINL
ncbi:hypothetical protein QJU23_01445 [Pasteurella atlantica]|uniref:Immunity protein 30 n=3 Tax=Pasteurellaceae TaxID=712 RepID=A0AAJ6NE75_9PAST|nr:MULTISPECIES: hypothetical protein [Pasteurella]MDP8051087.1 hypothetical protein [Pasteurella atlantica]MDP8104383.1 hypothetical protein [Pasteurella atlantica]MDP8147743.1 hypothetical protein [Pasteurella atlantica]MDP8175164.1 hypothetical protein [Pasteurella skyensis]